MRIGIRRALLMLAVIVAAAVAIACASAGGAEDAPAPPVVATAPPVARLADPAPTPAVTTPDTPDAPAASAVEPADPIPELVGLAGWVNAEPFTIAERTGEGGVVLIDFWTYTCVNCIRTFPFLREWQDKYGERGLTILGVHTPEFDFEKNRDNVLDAMTRFELDYPVAQDNDYLTWDAFMNGAWPSKYLFGADGQLRYTHIGEGDYVDTEAAIRTALTDAGFDVSDIPLGTDDGPALDTDAYFLTDELYAGYRKVYGLGGAVSVGPVEYYEAPDRVVDYQDPEFHHSGKIYLQGPWLNESDALVHARETTGLEDYMYARVFARSANIVIEQRGDTAYDVFVELDGGPVPPTAAGTDIEYDADGRSYIRVEESRLYNLLELPEFGEHELIVRSDSDLFAISSFTFGNYLQGP